jgi:hypothetical protein
MDRFPGRIASAGSTPYNHERLVIALPDENQARRRTDGHDQPCFNPHIAATSSSYRANKTARERTARPANGQLALAGADSPPIRPCRVLKAAATTSTKSP